MKVKENTGKRLIEFGAFRQSYDDVISGLLDACEVLRSVRRGNERLEETARRLVREANSRQVKAEAIAAPV